MRGSKAAVTLSETTGSWEYSLVEFTEGRGILTGLSPADITNAVNGRDVGLRYEALQVLIRQTDIREKSRLDKLHQLLQTALIAKTATATQLAELTNQRDTTKMARHDYDQLILETKEDYATLKDLVKTHQADLNSETARIKKLEADRELLTIAAEKRKVETRAAHEEAVEATRLKDTKAAKRAETAAAKAAQKDGEAGDEDEEEEEDQEVGEAPEDDDNFADSDLEEIPPPVSKGKKKAVTVGAKGKSVAGKKTAKAAPTSRKRKEAAVNNDEPEEELRTVRKVARRTTGTSAVGEDSNAVAGPSSRSMA